MKEAPIIAVSRLRMGTDGKGVTTLVAFYGCPLWCEYCINLQCHSAITKKVSASGLMKMLRKDELYFLATKGGVTFGGGEPYLHTEFIKEVLDLGASEWHTTIETSLNVPLETVKSLSGHVDEYYVDIKDMNPSTYERYTKKDNSQVLDNLRWLIGEGLSERIVCRIPLIPSFNGKEAQMESRKKLLNMGITRFDLFKYRTNINKV